MEPYANVRAMGLTLIKRFVFLGEVFTEELGLGFGGAPENVT